MTESSVITDQQRRAEIEAARDAGTVEDKLLTLDLIREVGTLDGGALQRWVVRVPLYPRHLYVIPGGRRNRAGYKAKESDWVGEYSCGVRAEGYDKLNKVAGIRFFTPETVHDREGREVPNPIHARDYLYHREVGQGYSETGQMVLYVEDIEIDYRQAWEQERLKKFSKLMGGKKSSGGSGDAWEEMSDEPPQRAEAKAEGDRYLVRDPESGMPKLDANGGLMFRLPEKDEADAMSRITTLRNYGGRQARTIARRRIFQQAFALRSLWTIESKDRPELTTQWVWVTGWRDRLTADEALDKAKAEFREVFGAPIGSYSSEDKVIDTELDESEDVVYAEAVEVDPDTGEVLEPTAQAVVVDPGQIPGVTRGMPGEKLARAVCGSLEPEGTKFCGREPGHCPTPHRSVDEESIWPCEREG